MDTRSEHKSGGFDLEGFLILLTLLVAGLIPVVAMIVNGPSTDYGTNLGFVVALIVLLVSVHEARPTEYPGEPR